MGGVTLCCTRRDNVEFEIIYKEPSGSTRRKRFSLAFGERTNKEDLKNAISKKVDSIDLPEKVKNAIKKESFSINKTQWASYFYEPGRLQNNQNQITPET